MFCKGCGYSLVSLTEYRCPECGREFNFADPSSFVDRRVPPRWIGRTTIVMSTYPIVVLLLIGLTWLIAYFSLGHPPRCMQDDPKSINEWVSAVYVPTMTAIMMIPIAFCLNLTWLVIDLVQCFRCERRLGRPYLRRTIMAVLMWSAFIVFAAIEPGRVFCWLFD